MLLSVKHLKHLSVETVSGVTLGHVHEVFFEVEGQLVAQYVIKPSMLSSTTYLVNRDQVVRFEKDKLVVDDTVVRIAREEEKTSLSGMEPSPVIMREDR